MQHFLSLIPWRNINAPKAGQMALKKKASLIKASYKSGASSTVLYNNTYTRYSCIQAMPYTHRYFLILHYSTVCVGVLNASGNFSLGVGGMGVEGEGSAWASFTVDSPRCPL
jgi:hypothetical protein